MNEINDKLNIIHLTFLEKLDYLRGVIDGVLQGVQSEKEKIKDKPILLEVLEQQEQAWRDYRKIIVSKIKSEKMKGQEGN